MNVASEQTWKAAGIEWHGEGAPFIAGDRPLAARDEYDVLRARDVRTIYHGALADGSGLIIKAYRSRGLRDHLRFLFAASRGRAEYSLLRQMYDAGVPVPEPVAWGETRGKLGAVIVSYVATREIEESTTLRDFLLPGGKRTTLREMTLDERRTVMRNSADLLTGLFDAGFYHRDLHAGNILRTPDGELFIIDVWGAHRSDSIKDDEVFEQIGHFLRSVFADLRRTDTCTFLGRLHRGLKRTEDFKYFVRRCLEDTERLQEDYWRGRLRRSEQKSGSFNCENIQDRTTHSRRPFKPSAIAVLANKAVEARSVRVLDEADSAFDVIEFDSDVEAREAWQASEILRLRRIDADVAVGWTHSLRAQRSTVVYAIPADDRPVLSWLSEDFAGADRHLRSHWIWEVACIVRRVHGLGLHTRRWSMKNIHVYGAGERPHFRLHGIRQVDCRRSLSSQERIDQLRALNASLPPTFSGTDRLRFFFAYARWWPRIRRDWKSWVSQMAGGESERPG